MIKKGIMLIVLGIMASMLLPSNVSALYNENLVIEEVPDVFYYRRGGGKPHGSGSYDKYTMNGKTVYCIEASIPINTSDYIGADGFVYSPYSEEINKKIELIGHYGYDYPGHQTTRFRMATQALIWENTSGQIVEFWTERSGHGDHIDVSHEKNIIMNLVNSHTNRPSFNATSINAVVGQEVKITDTNGVLSDFQIYNSTNLNVRVDGNDIYVTPQTVGNIQLSFIKKHYDNATTIVFIGDTGNSQKMGFFRFSDPVLSSINLNVIGGKVTLEKFDIDTGLQIGKGEALLSNAKYGIYNLAGTLIQEITTDDTGTAISDFLPNLGRYYLQEIKAPVGYTINSTKYYFEITSENLFPTVNVDEKVIEREVELSKFYLQYETGIQFPEENIKFEFYNNKNELVGSIITDSQGCGNITLPYGTYIVKQKNALLNYEKVEDFEIVIDGEETNSLKLSMVNKEITAKLKIVKVDKDNNDVIPLKGITFKIFSYEKNDYICQNITYPTHQSICEFSTDENGVVTTPYDLSSGLYRLDELDQQITGYLWNDKGIDFEVGENAEIINDSQFGKIIEITFPNKEVKGKVEIIKKGQKIIIEDDKYIYEEIPLENVSFDLIVKEDIFSAKGDLIFAKDSIIKSGITNDIGSLIFDNLYLGSYCIVETNTLDNHELLKDKHCFKLEYRDQYTEIIKYEVELKNYIKKGILEFTKTDLVTGEVIPNTIIEIYTENDELIFTGTTDENGKITINDLFVGKFYIIEKEPATGYILTEEVIYFEILENGEIIKANMTNKPITGTLEFTKVDFSTSETLPNTLIEIYTIDNKLIFSGRTDENGTIVIPELRFGKYYILEKEAPTGYILNNEKMYFEITEDGEIIKSIMTNVLIPDVPNTSKDELPILQIITILLAVVGIGVYIYAKKKK